MVDEVPPREPLRGKDGCRCGAGCCCAPDGLLISVALTELPLGDAIRGGEAVAAAALLGDPTGRDAGVAAAGLLEDDGAAGHDASLRGAVATVGDDASLRREDAAAGDDASLRGKEGLLTGVVGASLEEGTLLEAEGAPWLLRRTLPPDAGCRAAGAWALLPAGQTPEGSRWLDPALKAWAGGEAAGAGLLLVGSRCGVAGACGGCGFDAGL